MKYLLLILLLFSLTNSFGQFSQQDIETDSSKIEITRNSIYKVYTETFKRNDSVWYNVTYIDDTTKLNTEGWQLKNGRQLGTWKEFDRQGNQLYTWNHDTHTCIVNPKLFPYHNLLEKMKRVSDKMIIDAYGKEFMNKHVIFDFDCYAYNKHKVKFGCCADSMWTEDYLGSWTEPMNSKPNSFLLRYEVRLNPTDEKYIELGICLDENGNYVPSDDDFTNNYGFEKVTTAAKKFNIDKMKAIEVANRLGFNEKDTTKINEFLFWENFRKQQYYDGQFRYYITELTDTEKYQKAGRQGIVYKYLTYVFNPWTGKFVEKKKMKSIKEWEELSGYSTGLIPDNE